MLTFFRGKIWNPVARVIKGWSRYECASLSAAVAFYAAVSLFPLMIVLVSGVGIFFEFIKRGQNAKVAVLEFFSEQVSPEFSAGLSEVFAGIQSGALINGPIAAVGFLIPASLAFSQIVQGFDRIWEVKKRRKAGFWTIAGRYALNRLLSFLMILGMGALVVFVFFGGTIIFAIKEFAEHRVPELGSIWGTRSYLLSLVGTSLAYGVVYHFLSKGRAKWKPCLMSGLIAGVLWEMGRRMLATLVIGQRFSAYGVVGTFLTVLLWIYYASMVLFVGALLVKVLEEDPAPMKINLKKKGKKRPAKSRS